MERSLAGVDEEVPAEMTFLLEGLVAVVALEWALACVNSLVILHVLDGSCGIATHGTTFHILPLVRVPIMRLVRTAMHSNQLFLRGAYWARR